MGNIGHIRLFAACVSVMAIGCSKSPDAATPADVKPADVGSPTVVAKKLDLTPFNGKGPEDFLTTDYWGAAIRKIVPQDRFACMNDRFKKMPDLKLTDDGAVRADLDGSHASGYSIALVNASSSGEIDIVLWCGTFADPDPSVTYQYFTSRDVKLPPPKFVIDWFYTVGKEGESVVRADGETINRYAFEEFVSGNLAEAPKATAAPAPVQPAPSVAAITPAPQRDELRERCVRQALTQGYRSGQCAYSFIDICIRTQSRSEMEQALRTDAMLGMGTAASCPNMPSTYVADFNQMHAVADRF